MTRGSCRGSLLILVMWSLSFLAVMAASVCGIARQRASLLDRLESVSLASSLAACGVERAKGVVAEPDLTESYDTLLDSWAGNNAAFKDVDAGEGRYVVLSPFNNSAGDRTWYGLVDEERKINLNTSSPAVIARLIQRVARWDESEATKVAYSIVDWRDQDSQYGQPDAGAEDEDYEDLPQPYGAKDAPFESLDELSYVRGMSRNLLNKIKDYVTIFGSGSVNINTAPKEVLAALGMDDNLVDKVIKIRRGSDGLDATADDVAFPTAQDLIILMKRDGLINPSEEAALNEMVSTGIVGSSAGFFSIHSRGIVQKNGRFITAQAVVDRNGKVYSFKTSELQWPSSN